MSKIKTSLLLYLLSSFLVLITVVLNKRELEQFVKPIVIPSIYFYYLQYRYKRINWWFSIAILACFIGDMIVLIDPQFEILWIVFSFLVCYIILIKFGIDDLIPQKLTVYTIGFGVISVSFLLFVILSIVDLIEPKSTERYILFLFYGICLLILTVIALFNFFSDASKAALYFSIMALCIVISDVFYSFYHFIEPFKMFNYINIFFQLASYYCMVSYFLVRIEKPAKFRR